MGRAWSGSQDAQAFSGAGTASERVMVTEHVIVSV